MPYSKTVWSETTPINPTNLNKIEDGIADATDTAENHAVRTDNPHGVTKQQVGLGNVDNVKQATKTEFSSHASRHASGGADPITPAMISAEPAFAKNTAFNKNFGTTAGTVAEGNHNHDNRYAQTRVQNGILEFYDDGEWKAVGGDMYGATMSYTTGSITVSPSDPETTMYSVNGAGVAVIQLTGTDETNGNIERFRITSDSNEIFYGTGFELPEITRVYAMDSEMSDIDIHTREFKVPFQNSLVITLENVRNDSVNITRGYKISTYLR